MPTIYVRSILGICLKFGNNLSKTCRFADFNRPKLKLYTNLQKKDSNGEQNYVVAKELLTNAHNIQQRDFGIVLRFGNNLSKMCPFTDFNLQNWTFAPILRKSTSVESKTLWWQRSS